MRTAWLDALFTTPALRAAFSDEARLQGMLAFEAALAVAESVHGVVPTSCVEPIAAACRADIYDLGALAEASGRAGNLAIPVVDALRRRVAIADGDAARFVHFGATSQDAMDTGLVLQLRGALSAIEADLARADQALVRLAGAHRRTPIAGRTWLQQAEPVTFGLKAALWLDALRRDRRRLAAWRRTGLVVQLGGAVGTLAVIGPRGLDVAAALAVELELGAPDVPWHTERDRFAELATVLGLLVGGLGKIARDLALLSQSEVAEAFEPRAPGRGGSSAMPQKQNPISCAAVLAAAARVPALVSVMLGSLVQEHERALGAWHAEWETLPEIVALAGGAAAHIASVLGGLEVDAARMRANLSAGGGLIHAAAVSAALTRAGVAGAHGIVEAACRKAAAEGKPLREVLAGATPLAAGELDEIFDPERPAGLADALIDRVLGGSQ